MTRCSFDGHVGDIIGTLIVGAALIMLRPDGHMEFEYLSQVLYSRKITFMDSVPSFFASFFGYVYERKLQSMVKYLRTLCCGGKFWLRNRLMVRLFFNL